MRPMPDWDSALYLKFADERTQPCRDLAARILTTPQTIIDLGCGPGNSTEVIAARFPAAAITGLDSSEAMIANARQNHRHWRWITADIAGWATGTDRYDLIFSNAALQWVPDHERLLPQLLDHASALAVQLPGNWDAPAHRMMRDVARRFGMLQNVREWFSHDEHYYYDILAPHCSRLDVWVTEYLHVMPDADAVVEWYRGSGLRPFLEALPDEAAKERFVDEYRELLRAAYRPRPDGRVVFEFRRLFFVAYAA
jgi:trans-aconitate 2-methyltransferase